MFTAEEHGISREGDMLDLAVQHDVVKKLGAFYSYGDQRLGQGREASKGYLRDHKDLADEIEVRVRTAAGVSAISGPSAVAPADEILDPEEELVAVEAGSEIPLDL
jgi:recombination protein RecA